jgi:hypothetical protein
MHAPVSARFVQGDAATMKEQIDWPTSKKKPSSGKPVAAFRANWAADN